MNQKWYRGGYLFVKQSAKDRKRGLKPWRRKFVAVHQNACTSGVSLLFELYQDEFTYKQVACVLLNDITSVKRCTSRTNRHAFAVLSPRRQLYLAADSETDALEWIAMLRKFMTKKPPKKEPTPVESEDDDVFNVSILPNEHSERLEIYENYRLVTDSPYLCLYNTRSRIVLQWKLINLKRFMLTKKCHDKDKDKILYISTNSRCKNGECEIILYCNRGKQLIAKLLEEVSRNKQTRISRRRSITSSMIFDITPEDLARLGTISESSSDDDTSKKSEDTSANSTEGSDTLGRDVRPRFDGVTLRQKSPTLKNCTGRQWRTPTVGKPVLKKRRAPQPPPSPSSTSSSSSSDKRSLEYSPSIASSSSTVTSDFDLSSVPEDDIVSVRSQCGTLKASVSDDSVTSDFLKEQRAYRGTAPLTPKPSPPRPKDPPKLSPLLQAKYKIGSVETLSSNKENRIHSPPVSPRSVSSANSSFAKISGGSPPIPPRRRKHKHATLERCTNIHTEMEKQSTPKPTLIQIANGELARKSSTLQRDRMNNVTLSDLANGGHGNYNNNSSASSSSDDAASESDGCYSDDSDDVMAGNWHYDIRPYIITKVNAKTTVNRTVTTSTNECAEATDKFKPKFAISTRKASEDKTENIRNGSESEDSDTSSDNDVIVNLEESDTDKTKKIVPIENDNSKVSDHKQQIENNGNVDVNKRQSDACNENKLNSFSDKNYKTNGELSNANENLDSTNSTKVDNNRNLQLLKI